MKLWVRLLPLLLYTYPIFPQIYINEIFPAPASNQSEWVELINPNDTVVILDGLIITNRNFAVKIYDKISFPPNSFLVILKDTLGFSEYLRCNFFLMNLPSLHNDWDAVTIRRLDSSLIDSLYYSSKLVKKGYSIERYDWSEPGYETSNLNTSNDTNFHTMCSPNSKRVGEFGLNHLIKFIKGVCILNLINYGRTEIKNIEIGAELVYLNENKILLEKILFNRFSSLKKKDTMQIEIPLVDYFQKDHIEMIKHLKFNISYDSLFWKSKREIILSLNIPKQFSGITINEILFDVFTGCGEFIEIVNTTSDSIDISNWKIINSSEKQIEILSTTSNTTILPNSFFVIYWDSIFFNCFEDLKDKENFYFSKSSFSLRNTGDQVILINKIGIIQDSLTYFPDWHKGKFISYKHKSLEKQIPTNKSYIHKNWFTCVDPRGATPGETNSVSLESNNRISITIEPNPFAPNSNIKPQTTISYVLPFKQARINAKVFDLNGIEIFLLANNQISPSAGQLVWNGDTNFGEKVKPGGYVLFFEAIDIHSGEVASTKTTIAVGW